MFKKLIVWACLTYFLISFAIIAFLVDKSFMPLLQISDFVADSKGNIIILSSSQNKITIISKNNAIIIKIYLFGYKNRLAIDKEDKLYLFRRNTIEVYKDYQFDNYYEADLYDSRDWILKNGGTIENIKIKKTNSSKIFTGARKPVGLGEKLFFEKAGRYSSSKIEDFIDSSNNQYKLNSIFWDKTISAYDPNGHFLYKVGVSKHMIPFGYPFPMIIINAILVLMIRLFTKIKEWPG